MADRRPYVTLDVFTSRRGGGSPIAIIANARDLDTPIMQAMARDLNFNNTVFILAENQDGHRFVTRTFSPGSELQVSGNALVGLGMLLAHTENIAAGERRVYRIQTIYGSIPIAVRSAEDGAVTVTLKATSMPIHNPSLPPLGMVLTCLGLSTEDVRQDHYGLARFAAPHTNLYVPLKTPAALSGIVPDLAFMERMFTLLNDINAAIYCYVPPENPATPIHSRLFAPCMGIAEEPAAGAGAVGLAAALHHAGPLADGDVHAEIVQGVDMGRPSQLGLDYRTKGGRIEAIAVTGGAIVTGRGTMRCHGTV